MQEQNFPSKIELTEAVLKALVLLGGEGTVPLIEQKVIEILNLPKEVIEFEHPDGLVTLLNYRLRWVRTDLKNRGVIINVERGRWRIVN